MPLSDIGKFVGRYFQVLAWLFIASMIISPIFFDRFHIDFSFILLFWAAGNLVRHNPSARKWTIGITGFSVAAIALMLVYAAIAGTDGMTVSFGARIEDPPFWMVAGVAGLLLVLIAIPTCLLLTPKARREFGVGAGA